MRVLKFGGTSVGSAERIKKLVSIITQHSDKKIVVLSAVSGTTNKLVEISELMYDVEKHNLAKEKIYNLQKEYIALSDELFISAEFKNAATTFLNQQFKIVENFISQEFNVRKEKLILSMGEIMSTNLFQLHLEEVGVKSALLSALNFMRIDREDEPDLFYIEENLKRELSSFPDTQLLITQGYICRNAIGEVDNLKRGGSDYTASLIGAALQASEVEIWTDIDGFHNNDPRFVENTQSIEQLSFDEAAELAYFGAKILHPASVYPCKIKNIPVWLKNTMQPEKAGTKISNETNSTGIKAVAAKDGITAIKVKSGRMFMAYGFMRRLFEVFETYKTPIDMVTTSEVAVSLTIDNLQYINDIKEDLSKFCTVEIDTDLSIICIVGDFIAEEKGYAKKVFDALAEIPIRMISYGGSKHNISILVQSKYKIQALKHLSNHIFNIN